MEALQTLVAAFPADLPVAVLVVLHIPPTGPSVLPEILARAGKLPARHPTDGELLPAGEVLVAPPDHHLVVDGDRVRVEVGPRHNGHRPSADRLLHSVALSLDGRGAGVVLSGTMDDGAAGLRAVRAVGGMAMAQAPEDAAFPDMPAAAIEQADPQVVLPAGALGARIAQWASALPPALEVPGDPEDAPEEAATVSTDDPSSASASAAEGEVTPFTCPDCGGTLWLADDFGMPRFHCRVGHSFSADGLVLGKRAALEAALWAAVVALEERADLDDRMVRRMRGHPDRRSSAAVGRWTTDADASRRRAVTLRAMIGELVEQLGGEADEETGDDGRAATAR